MTVIKITVMVVTARYGTLSPGDILRTSESFAAHLVNDCKAAKYMDAINALDGATENKAPVKKPGRKAR